MPCDYNDYHPEWKSISRQIKDQAGNRCETCGVPNGAIIVRDGETWRDAEGWGVGTRIVLTVHHRCECDKRVCTDPSHLVALCQKHHLAEDMAKHQRNAAATRRRQRVERGQQELIPA